VSIEDTSRVVTRSVDSFVEEARRVHQRNGNISKIPEDSYYGGLRVAHLTRQSISAALEIF
jgi:hypothetical protein